MKEEVFSMDRVTTEDPELTDLNHMTMRIFKGEIAGLLPDDEQGKKKLLEVMQQNVPLHYGRVYMNGELVNSYLKSDYTFNRIYIISDQNRLVPDLTVSDNLFVLRKGFHQKVLNRKLLNQQARRLLENAGLDIAPDTLVSELGVFERISIELVRAVIRRSRLIVFDETSSFLSAKDVLRLRDVMRYYVKQGISFLYIGNHHEELLAICDRIMVMQYGRVIKNVYDMEISDEEMLKISAPESILEHYMQMEKDMPREAEMEVEFAEEDAALEFCDVTGNYLKNLSFSVQPGECIAILDRSMPPVEDIRKILTGENKEWDGAILCNGERFTREKNIRLLDDSIGIIQEHAHRSMIFPDMTFMENLCFMSDRKIKNVFLQRKVRSSIRKEYWDVFGRDLDIRDMRFVSKESKYMLVYYRYLMLNPRVVFCIQPYSSVDVTVRTRIHELIRMLKRRGIAVVIVTAGLTDAHFVSDRILMLEKGSMAYEFKKEEFKYVWDDLLQSQ